MSRPRPAGCEPASHETHCGLWGLNAALPPAWRAADAPIAIFPISWQDTGSGVFTVAVATLLLGFGPVRAQPARRLAVCAILAGAAALLVDIYLY
jgi:hypothetical protein